MLLSYALKASALAFITFFSIAALFFSFNCMILYILLLSSFYSFIALCFPATPKPKVVLTPGLEQILLFFYSFYK